MVVVKFSMAYGHMIPVTMTEGEARRLLAKWNQSGYQSTDKIGSADDKYPWGLAVKDIVAIQIFDPRDLQAAQQQQGIGPVTVPSAKSPWGSGF